MLTRASFRRFKNLRSVDVDLTQLTLLVGPNGAGKTSVMQGIHLLTQITAQKGNSGANPAARFGQVFTQRATPGRLVTSGGRCFELMLALNSASRAEEVKLEVDVDREYDRFTLEVGGAAAGRWVVERDASVEGSPAILTSSINRLASAVYLHLNPAEMVRPSLVENEEPRLEYDGEGLASVLSYLSGEHPDRKEAIEADLAKIVPWFRGIRVRNAKVSRLTTRPFAVGREAVSVPVEEEIWGHRFAIETTDGTVVPADMVSEGTVLALGLLTMFHHPRAPRLVLLDDLDRGLHLGAQVRLVRVLRAILEARSELQIVASSHSPFLLQEVSASDVRVLGLTRDGVACRALTSHPDYAKWRSVLGTGEMWANLGEDWVGDGE